MALIEIDDFPSELNLHLFLRFSMPMLNNIDPENHQFLEETNLPTPIYQGLC